MFFESIFNVFLGRKLAKAFVYLFIAIFVASDFLLDFISGIRAGRGEVTAEVAMQWQLLLLPTPDGER